ncbi:Ada metal-binding domain-containing protein [Microbacterium aquimaris]|uniref:DNA-3-methyladenine glycosylase 2 family protein n=1 Tax=Microbacterium aquimaris TaxID=459816 RepID=UPI002AD51963|nr:Ada metal-binding domain-containing protein [Microbacterium aquimaris]MDZ8274660.1 Ada metal-binding domain-containing protein [Microbacterium aquimaris]
MTTPAMSFDERYRVIRSRDRRFDGQFVTAVRSTGIYCRPSCPARTPKEANVTFYATSAAAHEAGYRACKRCLPEAAPGSPQWNLRGDVTARAMRLIADGVVEREGVPGLAGRLGYSSRHLTRLLAAELGAGPLALSRAHRAHTARMLLVGTDMPAADVAFSAGFRSVRQFNDTVREVFGMTPLRLRATRRAGGAEAATPGAIDLLLPHRAPLDGAGLFAWMAARAVRGVEVADASSFSRAVRLPGGVARFRIRLEEGRVRLNARLDHVGDLPVLVTRVRRLFDLDADPVAVDEALSQHPELTGPVAAVPGIRVPGAADPHEMLIRAMVGQQITVGAARTALTALTDQLGERIEPHEGIDRLFPTMTAIAEHGHDVLRGPAARIRAITGAAAALASGDLVLGPGDDGAEQRAALLARPGIGPWTADYVRMRVLGDPDVTLPGDVAVRSGAAALGIPSDPRGLTTWAERLAPWRSYLTAHLWAAAPVATRGARTRRVAGAAEVRNRTSPTPESEPGRPSEPVQTPSREAS